MQFQGRGIWQKTFAVPTEVADKHLKQASGQYLRILLALLRQDGPSDSARIAQLTGDSEADIAEAVSYWTKSGILSGEKNNSTIPAERKEEEAGQTVAAGHVTGGAPTLTAVEISERMASDEEIAFLFSSAEGLFGRPITSTEQRVLISMHEYTGLPVDVLLMLIEYCLSIDKKSIRYMEKTAAGWADQGIITHEAAESYIRYLKHKDEMESQVRSCFGIQNRNLSTKEKKLIAKWADEFSFDIEMIRLAYDKTVDNTGKLSFPYMDKILTSWHEQGIRKPDEIDGDKPAAASNLHLEKSFDVDEFERMGIFEIPDIK